MKQTANQLFLLCNVTKVSLSCSRGALAAWPPGCEFKCKDRNSEIIFILKSLQQFRYYVTEARIVTTFNKKMFERKSRYKQMGNLSIAIFISI